MEGQAILALLAVLALGMVTGGVLVSAAIRALSGTSATPHALPTLDIAAIQKELQDFADAVKKAKGGV